MNNGLYIQRNLEEKIIKYLDSPEILAIIGPRQSGKTTIMSRIYKTLNNAAFITFEDIETLSMFETDIKNFIKLYINPFQYIFIDEFQYSGSGGKHLKFIYDTIQNKKIIISGSSSIDMTIKALSYLVGRVLIFELFPLSFNEFLGFKDPSLASVYREFRQTFPDFDTIHRLPDISQALHRQFMHHLEEYVIYGGFPRIVKEAEPGKKIFLLKNIVNTYLLKDFREISGFLDDVTTLKLIKALALQVGNLVEYKELSLLSSSTFQNVKRNIDYFEKTFILKMISPFYTNKRNELVKNPKVFFIDTGLRNSLIDDFKPVESRLDKGAIWENFVFSQLNQKYDTIKYWRSKGGSEVDFILEKGPNIIPLEIKSNLKDLSLTASLTFFRKKYSPAKAFVFNSRCFGQRESEGAEFYFLPLWMS